MTPPDDHAIAAALRAQQVHTHRLNMPWAVGGSATAALIFVAVLRGAVPDAVLVSWLSAVGAVLLGRVGIGLWHRRFESTATPGAAALQPWLGRYRLGYVAHGLVWSLAGLIPLPPGDALHLAVLIIVLACITASNFVLTAFDLVAALCFGIPVLSVLSARLLLLQQEPLYALLGLASLFVLGFLSLTARRANGVVREYVALRLAQSAQTAALRSSEDLLERTGATAGVGGWELDRSARPCA